LTRLIKLAAFGACLWLAAAGVADAKTKPCGAVGKDVVEVQRNLRSCLASNVACAAVQGLQVFNNNERRLPAAGHNQAYYEARVGTDHAGAGGVRRVVDLAQGAKGSASVLDKYYSADHYATFCELT
jgi:guanyl-specific ribonuclease Sa